MKKLREMLGKVMLDVKFRQNSKHFHVQCKFSVSKRFAFTFLSYPKIDLSKINGFP